VDATCGYTALMVNELAQWVGWVLGRAWIWKKHASGFLGGAKFGTDQPIVIERPERCSSRDELARSVNQDVMLTFVVRDETEPVRPCRDRGLLLLWAD